nr:vacuolar-processing enzyme-like [Tanacetum cinerariifolium]
MEANRGTIALFTELAVSQQVISDTGTTWAVLIAGSKRYSNYRHQYDNWIHVTPSNIYAMLFVDKSLVKGESGKLIYVEACHSWSIFKRLLPDDMNIYVMIASPPVKSSYGAYCNPPFGYVISLGDRFSVAWMEDSFCKHFLEDLFMIKNKKDMDYNRLICLPNAPGAFNDSTCAFYDSVGGQMC